MDIVCVAPPETIVKRTEETSEVLKISNYLNFAFDGYFNGSSGLPAALPKRLIR
jgi:hypothetical protein